MISDQKFMLEAIHLAKKGWFTTAPNPRVGCVLVKDNQVISRGWHQTAGEEHAEICALRNASSSVKGATAYITLEPCSHFGKTPPCCDALIEAGIKRAVIAMQDPNPLVSGQGIKRLKDAGMEVEVGVLEKSAQQINEGFIHRMQTGKPFIRCKMAMSFDGRTAMESGESKWITSADARSDVQKLRAQSSAIITGIGTVLADDPSMTVRDDNFYSHRQPHRIILDSQLQIPLTAKILQHAEYCIIFTADNADSEKLNALNDMGATIFKVAKHENGLCLNSILDKLALLEMNDVLLEAGETLAGAFLSAQLINELIIYMAPKLMGNKAKALFALPQINVMQDSLQLEIKSVRQIGVDLKFLLRPEYH